MARLNGRLVNGESLATYQCIGCWNLVILYGLHLILTNLSDMSKKSELDSQCETNVLLDRPFVLIGAQGHGIGDTYVVR